MKKIYYLKTCDTCKRILKQLPVSDFLLQDLKSEPINVAQLETLYNLTRSYEALFSRLAKKYKQMDLKNQVLTEKDYRQLILDDYTFLKRPVIVDGTKIFIGSSKKTLNALLNKP
ncbi:MAG: arsenate reductase [Flavobacteriales bacterium CG03_land_8_20_14_0_80_35_15]|nr:arsenate reductase [Zetaproteobacteria bacterium]OIO13083.1 MAG: arsenate reductase [Flavobacteriaceae bacterium CG1_02_35_72]PIR14864.1 MAG: arsenate reductase [Flavobacteriales bacterium CG11_big_fil_rev_8_21_14_0_20_35_7]PIV17604.1 MAG: arsenate reductase [Flavobacteriales bacterium CG03_land_8_20_14_0_80_35_15]PIX05945.1 MAG: arsenate reductase [Flavobacteriales bacterium CG_4_8_14_3_um_filter_35_10]PJA06061.1 MAG: arsenate reductase [Flavobacteriales bacterium CG_4_10_14_0_2_um_filter_